MKVYTVFLSCAAIFTLLYIVSKFLINTRGIPSILKPVVLTISGIGLSDFVAIISLLLTAYFSIRAIDDSQEGSREQKILVQDQVAALKQQQAILDISKDALKSMVNISEQSNEKLQQANNALSNLLTTAQKQELVLRSTIEVAAEQLSIQKATRQEEQLLKSQHPILKVWGEHTIYLNSKNEYTYDFTGREDEFNMTYFEDDLINKPVLIPIAYTISQEVTFKEDNEMMKKYPKLSTGTEKIGDDYFRKVRFLTFPFKLTILNEGSKHATNVRYELNYANNVTGIQRTGIVPQLSIFENTRDKIELVPYLRCRDTERDFYVHVGIYGDNLEKREFNIHFEITSP